MKKTIKNFEKLALTGKQVTQIVGGGWIHYCTAQGNGGFNDTNNNGRQDAGETWYFIPRQHAQ